MTRAEHLAWCKTRALEYCARGNVQDAFTSMVSDLRKHSETEGHIAIGLGMDLLVNGHLDSALEMAKFIKGFN